MNFGLVMEIDDRPQQGEICEISRQTRRQPQISQSARESRTRLLADPIHERFTVARIVNNSGTHVGAGEIREESIELNFSRTQNWSDDPIISDLRRGRSNDIPYHEKKIASHAMSADGTEMIFHVRRGRKSQIPFQERKMK
jgi:hypothetical protein